MKGVKFAFNIDRLEVCYIASKEVIDNLEDTTLWEREGYRIKSEYSEGIETLLKVEVIAPETESGYRDYARIRIGNTFEKEGDSFRYCWIRLENEILYRDAKEIAYLYWLEEDLSLSFNNISYIELALDSSKNFFKRARAAIRSEEFTPIVLGRAYPELREVIPSLKYIHTGDRRRYRTESLLIKSKDKTLALEIYEKSREIGESGKEYIRESFGGSSSFYRLEAKIRNKALKDYTIKSGLSQEDIYRRITERELLFEVWLFYTDKLLRFVDGNRNKVSILQL